MRTVGISWRGSRRRTYMNAISRQPIDRPCSRAGCPEPSFGRKGNDIYCIKHRAFSVMRANAKQRGKAVPSLEELERLLPTDMRCPACRRVMNWKLSEGRSTALTLQHDRSGAFRLICQGCNTRHRAMPEDTFYDLPDGNKYCASCDRVKPMTDFAVDRSRLGGRKAHCKDCCKSRYEANRDYWRNRAKKKSERDR